MEFIPGLPLADNVFLDLLPVSPLADGGEVETVAPKLTAPELSLELRKLFEQLTRGDGFEDSHHVRATVFGWKGSENVDVVLIIA